MRQWLAQLLAAAAMLRKLAPTETPPTGSPPGRLPLPQQTTEVKPATHPQLVGCFRDYPDHDLPLDRGPNRTLETCSVLCTGSLYMSLQDAHCLCGYAFGKWGETMGCDCPTSSAGAACVYAQPQVGHWGRECDSLAAIAAKLGSTATSDHDRRAVIATQLAKVLHLVDEVDLIAAMTEDQLVSLAAGHASGLGITCRPQP
mmetsp:Transcript_13565/g.32835  ORF Transcript_13565/g.32835 Transcript_13565/m.32835 type:complete len:201 (-) Transcript_13565:38-640(-)